ncbi:MAG: TetR family transcriptional regulator [Myxococcota bacterium]
MGYSAEHTDRTRRRILDAAGRLFRRHGYAGARIDEIMAEADLTRGGFYAHFSSKADLFAAVMEDELEFTVQLRRAVELDPEGGGAEAIAYYLDPANRRKIARGCTVVSNAADLARADAKTRRRFAAAYDDLVDEFAAIARGGSEDARRARGLAALATCVGAVVLARALQGEERIEALMRGAHEGALAALSGPAARQAPERGTH